MAANLDLKNEIASIVATLKKEGKIHLAKCIEKNWKKTAIVYSKELNSWKPAKPMEEEMIAAFEKELKRIEAEEPIKIIDSLKKNRILQTAPHLGATEGPRMLCVNYLGSLGVPPEDFYMVGMFSGIPFSNRSRPGRINKKEASVNLFGSSMQDGLVYRSVITEKLIEGIEGLDNKIKELLPKAKIGDSYTSWALKACSNIERKILKKENLIYLDINEVVAEYLIRVLQNKDHIFYKIFFDPSTQKEFTEAFPNEIIFYSPIVEGKYEKMENVVFKNGMLESKNKKIPLNNEENLINELKHHRLCPALITGFLSLAFINQFKCLGSFAQVEYLPVYQQKLSKLKFMEKIDIKNIPTSNLTTGTFDENVYPVDIILGEKFPPNRDPLFGELLIPIKEVLLKSYFTGDQRNYAKKSEK